MEENQEPRRKNVIVSNPMLVLLSRMIAFKIRNGGKIGLHLDLESNPAGVDDDIHDTSVQLRAEGAGEPMEIAFIIRQFLEAEPKVRKALRALNKLKLDPGGFGQELDSTEQQLKQIMDDINNES